MAHSQNSLGTEATCDYRGFRFEDPWSFRCRCGSAACAGTVRATALTPDSELTERWASLLLPAIAAAARVPQETPVRGGDVHGTDRLRP
ncbi:hypothetical protein [Solwaraspora sp. WMMA2065]|uniref:hypothetical protein n=1 Tax=Solwaraspora sp. WMMA2065 TaxID=3015166 RepID=UPI00259B6304|nr:hypothetical protein [Solwaraspora sp. WMMA2065]WJK33070.1 hypothetical protein O7610_20410 [Solwaraspora sp. WMMA2065]